jgi:hypothetical protein
LLGVMFSSTTNVHFIAAVYALGTILGAYKRYFMTH